MKGSLWSFPRSRECTTSEKKEFSSPVAFLFLVIVISHMSQWGRRLSCSSTEPWWWWWWGWWWWWWWWRWWWSAALQSSTQWEVAAAECRPPIGRTNPTLPFHGAACSSTVCKDLPGIEEKPSITKNLQVQSCRRECKENWGFEEEIGGALGALHPSSTKDHCSSIHGIGKEQSITVQQTLGSNPVY